MARAKNQPNTLNAVNLKNLLWETINDVKSGTAAPETINSIATGAREILRATALQVKLAEKFNTYTQDIRDFAGIQ